VCSERFSAERPPLPAPGGFDADPHEADTHPHVRQCYDSVVDPAIATQIASHGLLGVLLVAVAWAYWNKDRELKTERDARISDAKAYNDLALKLQAQVIDSVNKLAETFDEMKKLMSQPRTGVSR
jgi:hypothetical protein